jgi:hypothetical protein
MVDRFSLPDNLSVDGLRRVAATHRGVPHWSIQLQCGDMVMTDGTYIMDYPTPTSITIVNSSGSQWHRIITPLISPAFDTLKSLANVWNITPLMTLILDYVRECQWLQEPSKGTHTLSFDANDLFPLLLN